MVELMTNMGMKMENVNQTQEFKDWLVSMLKFGPVKVKFEKTDGSMREMSCTLKEDMVVYQEKKTDRVKIPNPDVCPVYDLDKKEWRSFRYDSVKEIRFEL
jgi:hypothetical protein